jgi:hypothetical protein
MVLQTDGDPSGGLGSPMGSPSASSKFHRKAVIKSARKGPGSARPRRLGGGGDGDAVRTLELLKNMERDLSIDLALDDGSPESVDRVTFLLETGI